MPADLSAEPHRSRRCCARRPIVRRPHRWATGIADCADLRIGPTLTRHAWYSGRFLLATSAQSSSAAWTRCASAPRRHCRRRTCILLPDPQRRDWSETLARMRFAFRPAVRFRRTSTRESSLRPVQARVRLLGLCRPRRPATLFSRGRPRTTSAQSQGRHNAEQGRRVRRSRRARTRSFGVLIWPRPGPSA